MQPKKIYSLSDSEDEYDTVSPRKKQRTSQSSTHVFTTKVYSLSDSEDEEEERGIDTLPSLSSIFQANGGEKPCDDRIAEEITLPSLLPPCLLRDKYITEEHEPKTLSPITARLCFDKKSKKVWDGHRYMDGDDIRRMDNNESTSACILDLAKQLGLDEERLSEMDYVERKEILAMIIENYQF